MDAWMLLQELTQQRFTLIVQGDTIRVSPASRLTADLRHAIAASKPELLALLRERTEDDDRETCRIIERSLSLPPGSLTLWEPIR